MTATILLVTLCLLLAINVPIAVCMGLATVAAMTFGDMTIPLTVVPQRMFTAMDSFPFMAIPFFMLTGAIMESGGISRRLINFAKNLVGFLPCGLGVITVVSSVFFGAMSGSSAATVAAIGGIMIPAMHKEGYDKDLAAAIAAASGPFGVVLPPSVPMITYAVVSGASITSLFMAGILPGLFLAVTLILVLFAMARSLNLPRLPFSFPDLLKSFYQAFWALLVPIIILGGIYGGIFTPTEAAAVAVLYGFVISLLFYRELNLLDLPKILVKAGLSTAIVLFIIATSSSFAWLLTSAQIPNTVARVVLDSFQNPYLIMLLINIILLVFGMVIETNALILLLTPILLPIARGIGLDLVLLGIIIVVNTAVGMITPPVALNVFIASSVSGETIERISRRVMPFLAVLLVDIFIITYFPSITLLIPKLLGLM